MNEEELAEMNCLIEFCDLCGDPFAFLADGVSDQLVTFTGYQFLCKKCLN